MSLESLIFLLRALIALSLLGFLLALFVIIWRSLRKIDGSPSPVSRALLTRLKPDAPQTNDAAEGYELTAATTLGRAASNTIVVYDDFASAQHARIDLVEGRWWLEDQGSRDGILLNDEPVEARAMLADGDIIGIGDARYRLSLEGEATREKG